MQKLNRVTFLGKIENGKLTIRNRFSMESEIKKYADCEVTIKIESLKSKRTIRQNSYYWGVVLSTIAHDTGHTQEELHAIFKKMFLPKNFKVFNKKEIQLDGTTTALSIEEFGTYIDRIIA
jgi:hypothetical protein